MSFGQEKPAMSTAYKLRISSFEKAFWCRDETKAQKQKGLAKNCLSTAASKAVARWQEDLKIETLVETKQSTN